VLKYKTDKAAEVGRLIAGLGRLSRPMAGMANLNIKEEGMPLSSREERSEEKTSIQIQDTRADGILQTQR